MNSYTANFSTGTVIRNFKRADYTYAWIVMGEQGGQAVKFGGGFTTNKKDAEKRAQAQINFWGCGEAEVVAVEVAS